MEIGTENDMEGIDLNKIVKETMKTFNLDPNIGVSFEYWSNLAQTFCSCGQFEPDAAYFLPLDELITFDNKSELVLRFSNYTGNVIDFSPVKKEIEVSVEEIDK